MATAAPKLNPTGLGTLQTTFVGCARAFSLPMGARGQEGDTAFARGEEGRRAVVIAQLSLITAAEAKAQIHPIRPKSSKKHCTGGSQLCGEVSREGGRRFHIYSLCAHVDGAIVPKWRSNSFGEATALFGPQSPQKWRQFVPEANWYH